MTEVGWKLRMWHHLQRNQRLHRFKMTRDPFDSVEPRGRRCDTVYGQNHATVAIFNLLTELTSVVLPCPGGPILRQCWSAIFRLQFPIQLATKTPRIELANLFFRDPFDKRFIICGFLYIVWEKPFLPSTKNRLDVGPTEVGHESSESRFDVQLCGGAFGTDALDVFHEVFPGLEEIRKGGEISWKTSNFLILLTRLRIDSCNKIGNLRWKVSEKEGSCFRWEVGKSLGKGMWKYFPWTHETHQQHPCCSDVQADVLADLDVLCSLARVALTAFGSQVKSAMNVHFRWTRTEGAIFLLELTSYFCCVFGTLHMKVSKMYGSDL